MYSTIHGEVKFEKIITGEKYPIAFSYCDIACEYHIGRATKDGKNMYSCCGECMLFPSKDQRDWSKFKVKSKFDISTLQPFDKVLGRDCNDEIWLCSFYCHYDNDELFPFRCLDYGYKQCVPYNEDTKHLVGTIEMPPKKYINWEE